MGQVFTLEELADGAGVSTRTVRFYISEGLLPGPEGRGTSATYGEAHRQRLRLIRLLSTRHLPLAEQRALLTRLTTEELQELIDEEERSASSRQPSGTPTGRAYIASLLDGAGEVHDRTGSASPSRSNAGEPALIGSGEQTTESWIRYRLADGVELQIRSDVAQHNRGLIGRLLELAAKHRSRQRWSK